MTSPRALFAILFFIVNSFAINNGYTPVNKAGGVFEIVESDEVCNDQNFFSGEHIVGMLENVLIVNSCFRPRFPQTLLHFGTRR